MCVCVCVCVWCVCVCVELQLISLCVTKVVAIRNYQPPGSKTSDLSEDGKGEEKKENMEKKEDEEKDEENATKGKDGEEPKDKEAKKNAGSHRGEDACLEGLTDDIQDMLVVGADIDVLFCSESQQIMQEAFQCPLPTLRALFEASGSDVNKFIMSSEQ